MKLERVDLFEVPPRSMFLRLITKDGLVGWGEPVLEGRVKTVRTAVEELIENHVANRNLHRIQDIWRAMYFSGYYRGGPIHMSAIAGIDQALWDLHGKHHGAPVYQLLGGRTRDRIPLYQWVGGDDHEEITSEAKHMIDLGYRTLKMDVGERINQIETPCNLDSLADRIRKVRLTIGEDVHLVVDFRGRTSRATAESIATRIDSLDIAFIEEPLSPEYTYQLGDLRQNLSTPIAIGDRLYTRWDFRNVLENRSADIIQPNISHAGGISETLKIAEMAEAFDVGLAPSCPLGPVALSASLHVGFAAPRLFVHDHGFRVASRESIYDEYLQDDSIFNSKNGAIKVFEKPGLGVDLDEQVVERRASGELDWKAPFWRHSDGSVAQW